MKRTPLLSLSEFERAHWAQRAQLRRYLTRGRGRHDGDENLWIAVKDTDAGSLKATSARSRIAFARALGKRFLFHTQQTVGPFSFVTLTPSEFAMPLSRAAGFDESLLVAWARKVLGSTPFIAVVEAALYTNRSLANPSEPTVSWHVHAITWKTPIARLRARVWRINEDHDSLVPGRSSAHVRALSAPDAVGRVMYMLKTPLSEYLVYPRKAEHVDIETGEITTLATQEFIQRKRAIRPGDVCRMMKVMGCRTLPDLTFGSRTGAKFLEGAAQAALANIQQENDEMWRKLKSI